MSDLVLYGYFLPALVVTVTLVVDAPHVVYLVLEICEKKGVTPLTSQSIRITAAVLALVIFLPIVNLGLSVHAAWDILKWALKTAGWTK